MRIFSYEKYSVDCIAKGEPVYPWAKPCDGLQVVGPLKRGIIVGSENVTGHACECIPEWEAESETPIIAFPLRGGEYYFKGGKGGGKK